MVINSQKTQSIYTFLPLRSLRFLEVATDPKFFIEKHGEEMPEILIWRLMHE